MQSISNANSRLLRIAVLRPQHLHQGPQGSQARRRDRQPQLVYGKVRRPHRAQARQCALGQYTRRWRREVTGLGVGLRYDGVQVPFWSSGRKLEYYNAATDDRAEVGSDILPVSADGEDCWFSPYANLAGSMMYAGSPNSGIYKIPVANPGSAVDQARQQFPLRHPALRTRALICWPAQRNDRRQPDIPATTSPISTRRTSRCYAQTTAEAVGRIRPHALHRHACGASRAQSTCMYVAIKEAGGETLTRRPQRHPGRQPRLDRHYQLRDRRV